MIQNFAAIILGGTGQVGGAAVAALLAIPGCREVVMVTRKPIAARSRVRNVILDTGAADFAERIAALAREVLSQGPVSAVSCVGVGSGIFRPGVIVGNAHTPAWIGWLGRFVPGPFGSIDQRIVS